MFSLKYSVPKHSLIFELSTLVWLVTLMEAGNNASDEEGIGGFGLLMLETGTNPISVATDRARSSFAFRPLFSWCSNSISLRATLRSSHSRDFYS